MALIKNIKYSYNDIAIVPAKISYISHRSECNPFYNDEMLPLFTAPMTSVVDENNFDLFEKNKIHAILPRTVDLDKRIEFSVNGKWAAFGLNEFEDIFVKNTIKSNNIKALIDVANGHMQCVMSLAKQFKEKYKNISNELMAGNIANPDTYMLYASAGIDYIRCSVGTGSVCLTTSNTSVHYPMASLIDELHNNKFYVQQNADEFKSVPKIIADGGVRNYSDAIKALALGADYVMIGGVFSKMLESSAIPYLIRHGRNYEIDDLSSIKKNENGLWNVIDKEGIAANNVALYKNLFGMASKEAQQLMHGKKIHTSEGKSKVVEVEYTIKQWTDNFIDYLRSAMSYTDAKDLQKFKNDTMTIVVSNNTYQSVNK